MNKSLPPRKASIFDLVRRAGVDGIAGDDLMRIAYDHQLPRYRGRGESRARPTFGRSIKQSRGHRIRGEGCAGGHYRLTRIPVTR
jgi:hypothetical protein